MHDWMSKDGFSNWKAHHRTNRTERKEMRYRQDREGREILVYDQSIEHDASHSQEGEEESHSILFDRPFQ